MGLPAQKPDQKYTFGDYYSWDDGERWELIDGRAFNMSPAPSPTHQEILGKFHLLFGKHFEDKKCKVYLAPFDVRLPRGNEADEEIDTVVQPDLSIICDTSKVDRRGCKGPPDLVLEILSPGSASRDMKDKLKLYEKHGVKEYWLAYPFEQVVEIFTIDTGGKYRFHDRFKNDETVESPLFPGLTVDLVRIFEGLEAGEV